MSHPLISRSEDLKRLRDEGYHVEVRTDPAYLLIKDVPYVTADAEVKRGTLVSTLALAGNVTTSPDTHVIDFIGDAPCDKNGAALTIVSDASRRVLAEGLVVDFSFSRKPTVGYSNYYEKITTYASILEAPAQVLDPAATAQTYPLIEDHDEDSVFEYFDSASSRAGIGAVTDKLRLKTVAIVGLGGTGSYVLDLVAKTPVREIHLFDGDHFLQHNAFRAPGAPSMQTLVTKPAKVDYFAELYANMRRGIVAHPEFLDDTNVEESAAMEFVFLLS